MSAKKAPPGKAGAKGQEKPAPDKGKADKGACKRINLALQGGGAHGAFTWGVLDQLLIDDRVEIEAISGTSAGAVNGVIMAYGLISGGPEEARRLLQLFWKRVSAASSLFPVNAGMIDKVLGGQMLGFSPTSVAFDYLSRIFSPYQFNLFDINPLRNLLNELVDFEALRKNDRVKLFINATNVRTGKIKVFETHELTLDMVMASACLPFIFKTVEVDGEPYWDGGYSGNPAIYPLIYHAGCNDVVIVEINPLYVEEVPTSAAAILDRVNEISFNSTLMREMRAIAFVTKLLEENKLDNEGYKKMNLHMIEAQDLMSGLAHNSKLNTDWGFLVHLHDIGVQATTDWLNAHHDKIGVDSSIDIRSLFL